jgi:hypothetical protein
MAKKGKTRSGVGGVNRVDGGKAITTTPPADDAAAAPKVETEPTPDLAAPEGATETEAEAAPEIAPDGGKKMELNAAPRLMPEGLDDKDLNVRSITGFVLGIFGLIGVAGAVAWGMGLYFRGELRAMDPPASPIPEANAPVLPPEPRLRENPPADMDQLRVRENGVLTTYGWVDRGAGIGRIPIDRAIDLAAQGKTAPKTEGDKQ